MLALHRNPLNQSKWPIEVGNTSFLTGNELRESGRRILKPGKSPQIHARTHPSGDKDPLRMLPDLAAVHSLSLLGLYSKLSAIWPLMLTLLPKSSQMGQMLNSSYLNASWEGRLMGRPPSLECPPCAQHSIRCFISCVNFITNISLSLPPSLSSMLPPSFFPSPLPSFVPPSMLAIANEHLYAYNFCYHWIHCPGTKFFGQRAWRFL